MVYGVSVWLSIFSSSSVYSGLALFPSICRLLTRYCRTYRKLLPRTDIRTRQSQLLAMASAQVNNTYNTQTYNKWNYAKYPRQRQADPLQRALFYTAAGWFIYVGATRAISGIEFGTVWLFSVICCKWLVTRRIFLINHMKVGSQN